jgi:translation initiation factor IF-1
LAKQDDTNEVEGELTEALPSTMFRLAVDGGYTVLATISGKMRKNDIRILPRQSDDGVVAVRPLARPDHVQVSVK